MGRPAAVRWMEAGANISKVERFILDEVKM